MRTEQDLTLNNCVMNTTQTTSRRVTTQKTKEFSSTATETHDLATQQKRTALSCDIPAVREILQSKCKESPSVHSLFST